MRSSAGNDEDAIAFCAPEYLLADAQAELSVLVDSADTVQSDDPVRRVVAVGVTDRQTDTFIPMVEVEYGATCSTDLAGMLCAVCFADFHALATGEGGETCGAAIETPGLAAVQMTTTWFDFNRIPIENETEFGQLKLTVRLLLQAEAIFDVSYDSGELMAALFGPGG